VSRLGVYSVAGQMHRWMNRDDQERVVSRTCEKPTLVVQRVASAYMRLPDLELRFDCAFLAQRLDHHGCQILYHWRETKGTPILKGFATHTVSVRPGKSFWTVVPTDGAD
jgi:hypothetical protein